MNRFVFVFLLFVAGTSALPVVIWPGLGSTSLNNAELINLLEEANFQVIVLGGDFGLEQISNSVFGDVLTQIQTNCDLLSKDSRLSKGFNALGLSQGGPLMMSLIQTCPGINVTNFMTFGSPLQGVKNIPCSVLPDTLDKTLSDEICDALGKKLFPAVAYTEIVQKTLVPATYYHSLADSERPYRECSRMLADNNNERRNNYTRRERIEALNYFGMVLFTQDEVVYPKISSHYGFVDVNGTEIAANKLSTWSSVGLAVLDFSGRLEFITYNNTHMTLSPGFINDTIIPRLNPAFNGIGTKHIVDTFKHIFLAIICYVFNRSCQQIQQNDY